MNERLAEGTKRLGFGNRYMDRLEEYNNVILVNEPDPRGWQCIECGTVVEERTRPKSCPHCNSVDGDLGVGVHVMAPRKAVGWFE